MISGTRQVRNRTETVNIIDTVGFCDTVMTTKAVLDVVKSFIATNLEGLYIDKVIFICAGRIEKAHVESIKTFLSWLRYEKHPRNFVFIYNKVDSLTDSEKQANLGHMAALLNVRDISLDAGQQSGI